MKRSDEEAYYHRSDRPEREGEHRREPAEVPGWVTWAIFGLAMIALGLVVGVLLGLIISS